MIKQIMIPMAAFIVTATGVSAFNSDLLDKINVNLTTSQVEALEESHALREAGEFDAARTVLEEAEIDKETIHEIRSAMHKYRMEMRDAINEAIENNNYESFKIAIGGSPLAEQITTENDFTKFVEAHELMTEGKFEEAHKIMTELGIERGEHRGKFSENRNMHKMYNKEGERK